MRTISKHVFAALIGAAILSSCSRPVAYFQPTERFHSSKVENVAVATPATTIQPTVEATPAVEVTPAPVEQVAQAKQAMTQLEAYVRNDNKLASNKKLTKRMAKVNELLATANEKTALSTNAASTQKTSLMQRYMLKKMNKTIKNHVAPDHASYLNKNTKNGIIIGAIGLILSLVFSGVIGVLALRDF